MPGKGFISEGDVALLLRRYTANTVLSLLQEVYNVDGCKLDWTSIVKNSNTGLASAKEYQILWRHLAYGANLPDTFEDDTEPLEDESDLEFEVEPLPVASPEVAASAAACVKVLTASGCTANAPSKSQEGFFVIDVPNSSSGWEVRSNGQISNVVIQGASTPESQPARKKRKLWTSEEDQELIAAVEKCGEGNWATMLKGAFKHERTAAQLSQRWALIRKRRDSQTGSGQNTNPDGQMLVTGATSSVSSQLPVEMTSVLPAAPDCQRDCTPILSTPGVGNTGPPLAAIPKSVPVSASQDQICSNGSIPPLPQPAGKGRPPMKRSGVPALQQLRATNPTPGLLGSSSGQATNAGVDLHSAKTVIATPASLPSSSSVPGRYSASSGIRNTSVSSVGRPVPKSSAGPDPMVQAAAVAAGARIAPASAAASLLKAAHSGNVVHIGPGGVSLGKSAPQSQTSSNAAGNTVKSGGSSVGSRTSAGTLVHYIRTGTGSPQSLHLASQRAGQGKGQFVKSGSPQVAENARPSAFTLSSPGVPSPLSLQKSHLPTFISISGVKGKASSSSMLPNDGRSTGNDASPAIASELIDGSSPSPEGNIKITTKDSATCKTPLVPINCHSERVSECLSMSQKAVAGKVCLSKSNELVDQSSVAAPSITIEAKGDPLSSSASTSSHGKVDESISKDSPEDLGTV